jgi:HSP20 family protein
MFDQSRWSPFDDIFNFQREADRLFAQFWNDLPSRSSRTAPVPFQVHANDDGWRLDVPLPGIDPAHVTLEATGNTLHIRAEQPGGHATPEARFDQSVTVPPFLDVEKISASHRHGMLQLTLPVRDSVKPRRIAIDGVTDDQKQLTAV